MIHSCDKILNEKDINYKKKLKYSDEFTFVSVSAHWLSIGSCSIPATDIQSKHTQKQ